ncbi:MULTISPECIES: MmgE/PrpD family protein [Brenneria]|uniref:Immunity protein n=1 Tax=Brenneria nigrifluens DSM 30175 = ATCC 13028 TaxID=1121120 RepID=A0A2U1UCD4_9GAMM|nr:MULTISPECIES: MmgE/PrpD family protein [Brenneria]EHD20836.1 MmgE/PrpD family protein [Brenneria sp. EniD312]PWC19262.1 immunity protein [Brenneria nigrifluens] [Brenneria nigrifluens DSM 30175 = ATCC 13028]QCR04001.1 MmgE/PrpD family protein [Brenneria nigrifluens] [Brenneria nigrifluens DSM 30175 = ATCC 13028]
MTISALPPITSRLTAFASQLTPEAIPAALRQKMALHFIDSLGCGIAGADSRVARDSARVIRAQYAPGAGIALDGGTPLSPVGAAFLNAAAINALDYDDGYEVAGRGMGHPGATLVAAALAAVGPRPIGGRALIRALTAAYEINGRVILSQQPSSERFQQVYGVCQHESLGAAVAYGLLTGCDADGLENALGLAASLTPLPSLHKYNWRQRPLVSFKDYNAPAAEAGVRAVELHYGGIVGPRDVLAGEQGFWRMMGSDRFDESLLIGELGEQWLARHASFKAYPVCRWLHTALESYERLPPHLVTPQLVERVQVTGSQTLASCFADARPLNATDAQFSLPVALACLAYDVPRHRWSDEETLADPRILAFADKVEIGVDPELNRLMLQQRRPVSRVEVVVGGRTLSGARIDFPLGCAQHPLSEALVLDKFARNLSARAAPPVIDAAIAALSELERCADIGAIIAPLLETR